MKRIKYFTIALMAAFAISGCTDIVEVDELRARENPPSNGTPTITRIALANDKEFDVDEAAFEDMIRIEGTNLGNVTSLKFNDIEVPISELYANYDKILAPVPRKLPSTVTNKLYITTPNGSIEFDLKVNIPQLKIEGLKNEFAQPGDTTIISGDNFDLYGITAEEAILKLGSDFITILNATRNEITVQIPASAQPNSVITILGSQMTTPYEIPYMSPGAGPVFDFNNWPGSGAFTHSSKYPNCTTNFLCTGTEGIGYPDPLSPGYKYLRFNGDVGAWGWMVLWAGYIKVPAEVAANISDYDFRFEILTNSRYPLSTTARILFGDYIWYPAKDGLPLNTYGQWQTVSISADTEALLPASVDPTINTPFKIIFSPESAQSFDVSMCNFRFEHK